MKNFFWLIIVLCTGITACSQTKTLIKGGKAYFFEKIPGAIQRDLNGNEVEPKRDTTRVIYIEVKGQEPAWKAAWNNNKRYQIHAMPVKGNSVIAGKRYTDGEPLRLYARKGYTLICLQLTESGNERSPKPLKTGSFLIEANVNGKPFFYTISNIVQIASPEFQ